jgi:hypothetical protein
MTAAAAYKEKLALEYRNAMEKDFIPFPYGIDASDPLNSTPFCAGLSAFHDFALISDARKKLVASLTDWLADLKCNGLTPLAVMVGGSFLDCSIPNPHDLDCVIFYRKSDGAERLDPQWLSGSRSRAMAQGLDARLVPTDADLIVLLRSAIYFSALYGQSKNGRPARGVVLINCKS